MFIFSVYAYFMHMLDSTANLISEVNKNKHNE